MKKALMLSGLAVLLIIFSFGNRFVSHASRAIGMTPARAAAEQTPPPIVSISVCSSDSHDGILLQGSCGPGTFGTNQLVLGPGGKSEELSVRGVPLRQTPLRSRPHT